MGGCAHGGAWAGDAMSNHERPLNGPPHIRTQDGTTVESWLFWPEEPALRCLWPTAALVERLLEQGPSADWYAVRTVLGCYMSLIAHPMGSELAVQRLRALRRAERGLVTP